MKTARTLKETYENAKKGRPKSIFPKFKNLVVKMANIMPSAKNWKIK